MLDWYYYPVHFFCLNIFRIKKDIRSWTNNCPCLMSYTICLINYPIPNNFDIGPNGRMTPNTIVMIINAIVIQNIV